MTGTRITKIHYLDSREGNGWMTLRLIFVRYVVIIVGGQDNLRMVDIDVSGVQI
jgi:hypothetical protein